MAIATTLGWQARAQNYDTNGDYVQTFAGSAFTGYVDGVGQQTMFNGPARIVADSHGNLFVWDSGNYRIREIAPNATVTTFVGGGNQTTGVGTNISLSSLSAVQMTIDHNDNIWMLAYSSSSVYVYEITSSALVTRTNLSLSTSSFPDGICVDSLGGIYISDNSGNKIYRYTNGVLSVFAGSGNSGYTDGNGIFTSFQGPAALVADSANNVYVWDSGNHLIRRIDQNQNVTTFAGIYQNGLEIDGVGTNASFGEIKQMFSDHSGNLYLACVDCIRKIDATTNVVTLAGAFNDLYGYTNGPGNLARFNGADAICLASNTFYVADGGNQRIRSITNYPTPQVVTGANLGIGTFAGVTITGIVGRTYQIQSSPDLNTWTTRATLLLNSSPYLWVDQNPVSGSKFYRALLLP
jgi:hypothetical protein